MLMYLALTIGAMVEVVLALLIIPTLGWRWWICVSSFPLILFFVCAYRFMPESPRYLLIKGDKQKALEIIREVATINGVSLPVCDLSIGTQPESGTFKDLFSDGLMRYI